MTINSFVEKVDLYEKFVDHFLDNSQPSIHQEKKYYVLIGPEGDFSARELTLAQEKGFKIVKLGNKRLRTETAALAACHTLNLCNHT